MSAPSLLSVTVCFIACHGVGPADHFATYAEELIKQGYHVQMHATGPALKRLQERGVKAISPFSLENLTPDGEDRLAQTIAKTCSNATLVITDVGHLFDVKMQQALTIHAASIPRFAYYDNPEPFVPGGYSSIAAKVVEFAEGLFFANDTLVEAPLFSDVGKEIDFAGKKRFGIGYYPITQAENIAKTRKSDHEKTRSTFLKKNEIEDKGQKILIYFGGNNEVYFEEAFPAFLTFLAKASERTDFGNTIIVLQQHPAAKVKNRDGQQVEAWKGEFGTEPPFPTVILSDFSSDEAQVLADAALYNQTSMGPQFVLAGIPTIQIGLVAYDDILVRNHLAPAVMSGEGLAEAIEAVDRRDQMPLDNLFRSLGIKENWRANLDEVISKSIHQPHSP